MPDPIESPTVRFVAPRDFQVRSLAFDAVGGVVRMRPKAPQQGKRSVVGHLVSDVAGTRLVYDVTMGGDGSLHLRAIRDGEAAADAEAADA